MVLPSVQTGPIPAVVLNAYRRAAASVDCGLQWSLLAGIGKIESDHGRHAGSSVDRYGETAPPIYGPPTYLAGARAEGPMQFMPTTWARWASDGNADGQTDPQNVYDETVAAARYLCAAGRDLSTAAGVRRAVFAYNHLDSYVTDVLAYADAYAGGAPESSVSLVPITYPPAASTSAGTSMSASAPAAVASASTAGARPGASSGASSTVTAPRRPTVTATASHSASGVGSPGAASTHRPVSTAGATPTGAPVSTRGTVPTPSTLPRTSVPPSLPSSAPASTAPAPTCPVPTTSSAPSSAPSATPTPTATLSPAPTGLSCLPTSTSTPTPTPTNTSVPASTSTPESEPRLPTGLGTGSRPA